MEEDEFQHEYEGQEHGDCIVIPIPSNEAEHVDKAESVFDHDRECIEQTTEDESIEHLSKPGTPSDRAGVVNGQMSWAKLYKTSSWHQVKTVLLLSLEKDNLALLQQGEVLEQEIKY